MAGRKGTARPPAVEGTSRDSEMCSKVESQNLMHNYFALVQAVHSKTRSYQALLSDFHNLTELYDKQRKLLKSEVFKRKEAEDQLMNGDERVRILQKENEEKERLNRKLNAELKDARGQVANQLGKINALQADLDEWENRMDIIKKNLKEQLESLPAENRKEMAFIREPALYRSHSRAYETRRGMRRVEEREEEDDESVDYDKTEDDIEEEEDVPHTRSGRVFRRSPSLAHRRSASAHVLPAKRSRVFGNMEEEVLEAETGLAPQKKRSRDGINLTSTNTEVTTTITFDEQRPVKAKVAIRRSMNRSMSESNLLEQKQQHNMRPTPMMGTTSTLDLRTPRGMAESWTRGRPIDQRAHRFEKMPTFFKMTSCDVCNGGINFAAKPAVRCIDCNQHAHTACKKRLVVPCVPKSATPRTPSRSKVGPRLQEFCPPTAPMIPAPIIHCVIALEKKSLDYPGIYRVPGNKAQVDRVLHELKMSRAVPKLELQDIEVITGCIKEFLRQLRDPLIPKTSREEFVRAATTENYTALHSAIRDLPQPNRDTLAFLCLHWLKVCARSTMNKMPMENLVRCLAPTIVGLHNLTSLGLAGDETNKALAVLEALLRLDTDYWEQFLAYGSSTRGGTAAGVGGAVSKSSGSTLLGGTLGTLSITPKAPPLLSASGVSRIGSRAGHNLDFSEGSSAVDQSILGPISGSDQKKSGPTPLIFDANRPRGGVAVSKRYFPSPL